MFPRVTHPSATSPEGPVRLACVRPAASVHSEPGSNSQVESSEELSLTSNLRTSAPVFACKHEGLSFHVPSYRSNVTHKREALPGHRFRGSPHPLLVRYANNSNAVAPKPPAYPFSHYICQRARTQNKQHTRTSGASAVVYPDFFTSVSARFPVPSVCIAASVRLR